VVERGQAAAAKAVGTAYCACTPKKREDIPAIWPAMISARGGTEDHSTGEPILLRRLPDRVEKDDFTKPGFRSR